MLDRDGNTGVIDVKLPQKHCQNRTIRYQRNISHLKITIMVHSHCRRPIAKPRQILLTPPSYRTHFHEAYLSPCFCMSFSYVCYSHVQFGCKFSRRMRNISRRMRNFLGKSCAFALKSCKFTHTGVMGVCTLVVRGYSLAYHCG